MIIYEINTLFVLRFCLTRMYHEKEMKKPICVPLFPFNVKNNMTIRLKIFKEIRNTNYFVRITKIYLL